MISRRDFFQAVGGVVAAGVAAPFLPIPTPPFVPGDGSLFNPRVNIADQYKSGLLYHRDAFALVMAPITIDDERNVAFEWDASCPAGYNAAHYS